MDLEPTADRSAPDVSGRTYVPFLKGKQGERLAVRSLNASVKAAITPAFQLIGGRTAAAIEREFRQLAAGWSGHGPVMIDAGWLDPAATSVHPMRLAGDIGRRARVDIIPVLAPGSDPGYRAAAMAVRDQHGQGAAFRLGPATWLPDLAKPVIDELLDGGFGPEEIDLLFDAGTIATDAALDLYEALCQRSLAKLPYLDQWRRVVILGGSFPADLRGIRAGTVARLPRREWALWGHVPTVSRALSYGDYGVAHPETADEIDNPRAIPIFPQIRYTTPVDFAVTKGGDVRKQGDAELYTVCARIVGLKEFDGSAFSPGDAWIAARATGSGSVGNYSTWRQVGTSHHITRVVASLASSSAP